MTKKEARAFVRAKKKLLEKEEIRKRSMQIFDRLKKQICFQDTEAVFTYVSYNQEVDTKIIIRKCLDMGKGVFVPKIYENKMDFFEIYSLDDIKPGYQGIMEPVTNECANVSQALMILPGLAFDFQKNRVGYGGGFYDRYLTEHEEIYFEKVALAFDFQVVDFLEVEEYDKQADIIITDKKMIGG